MQIRVSVPEPKRHACPFFSTYITDGCFTWGVWTDHGCPVICAYLVQRGNPYKTWPIYKCPQCGESLPWYHLEKTTSYPKDWSSVEYQESK